MCVHVSLTPNSRCSLYVQVFPTALRNSGINVAAVVSMVVGMSAPYAIDLVTIKMKEIFHLLKHSSSDGCLLFTGRNFV